jgi:hypothetical protein
MKNKNSVSHTATVRGQFHADELAVLFFTGLTLEGLTDLKLDMGKEWLMKYCCREIGLSEKAAMELWMEPLLMQWWNLEWRRMDHFIILPMLHKIVDQERGAVYEAMHGEVFLSDHPNYRLMELSLLRVCKNIIDIENAIVC